MLAFEGKRRVCVCVEGEGGGEFSGMVAVVKFI